MKDEDIENIHKDILSSIKRKKTQKRILPSSGDGVTREIDETKGHVPGEGIVEGERITEKTLDCNHPSSIGVGHIADCGHTICKICMENEKLVCAERGCYKKFCTVKGCRNHPRIMIGLPYCKKHWVGKLFEALSNTIFLGSRRTQKWKDDMNEEYYSKHFPEKRKESPRDREDFPRRSS